MVNLLEETISRLIKNKKSENDVVWVGNYKSKIDWDAFKEISNFEYDSGFGENIISLDLLVVGKDWWMERYEYDGSEWWEFKHFPPEPIDNNFSLKDLMG